MLLSFWIVASVLQINWAEDCIVPRIWSTVVRRDGNVIEPFKTVLPGSRIVISCSQRGDIIQRGADVGICLDNGDWMKLHSRNQSFERNFGVCQRDKSQDYECGLSHVHTAKVYGGELAQNGEFPWMAKLGIMTMGSGFPKPCGGSLLNEQWVLTAAHCVDKNVVGTVTSVSITLGRTNFTKPHEASQRIRHAQPHDIYLHPLYDRANHWSYDFALIRLNYNVSFNRYVRKICLPDQLLDICTEGPSRRLDRNGEAHGNGFFPHSIDGCSRVTAAGWGLTEEMMSSYELKKVNLTVYSESTCAATENPAKFCAGSPFDNTDTCVGDSGGPLMCKASDNRFYVVGVVSYGIDCGSSTDPGVYSRVCSVLQWIHSKISPQTHASATSTTTASTTTTTTTTTTPIKTDCPRRLPRMRNGEFGGRGRSAGTKRPVVCLRGRYLVGPNVTECVDGAWTRPGRCRKIKRTTTETASTQRAIIDQTQCPPYPSLPNGSVQGRRNRNIGARLRIRCDSGFRLSGPSVITCLPTGTWSHASVCQQQTTTTASTTTKTATHVNREMNMNRLHEELFEATQRNNTNLAVELLNQGATNQFKDSHGVTALHFAALRGNYEVVRRLLLLPSTDVNTVDENNRSPLMWASYAGSLKIVKLLLAKGADAAIESNSNYWGGRGQTAASEARNRGHSDVAVFIQFHSRRTTTTSSPGRTTHQSQASCLFTDLVRQHGYNKLLYSAAVSNRTQQAVTYINCGAENYHRDDNHATALHRAAAKGNVIIVRKLLALPSTDVDVVNRFNRTPLMWAAIYGRLAVIKLLIDHGASINVRSSSRGAFPGETALGVAIRGAHTEVVDYLRENGGVE